MNNLPHELVAAHLNVDLDTLKKLAQSKSPVVPL
jgi:oxalate decarboxylase